MATWSLDYFGENRGMFLWRKFIAYARRNKNGMFFFPEASSGEGGGLTGLANPSRHD